MLLLPSCLDREIFLRWYYPFVLRELHSAIWKRNLYVLPCFF
jgi:hypothetical protein